MNEKAVVVNRINMLVGNRNGTQLFAKGEKGIGVHYAPVRV